MDDFDFEKFVNLAQEPKTCMRDNYISPEDAERFHKRMREIFNIQDTQSKKELIDPQILGFDESLFKEVLDLYAKEWGWRMDGIDYPGTFTEVDKINHLQRKIILNSIMYYNYNKSFLTDYYYDQISHQLVELQKEYNSQKGKSVKKDTKYGYLMYDFDGSTGFDLYNKLNEEDEKDLLMNCGYKLYREEKK